MTNRRTILQGAAALPLAGIPFEAAFAAEVPKLALERFVFDVRFAEPGAVAEEMKRRGVRLAPIADDLMTLWYDELDLAWREKPMALAGVTLAEARFVLETFALDRGMHVVYRGEHSLVENGRIAHRFTGPEALIARIDPLPSPWERALAAALTACPLGASATARVDTFSEGAALSLRDMPLESWIIAPRGVVTTRIS